MGTGLTTQLAAGLAPALANVTSVLVDAVKNTGLMDQVSRILAGTFKGLVTGVIILGTAFKAAFQNVAAVAKSFGQIITGDFVGAWKTISGAATRTVDDYRGAAGAAARRGGVTRRDRRRRRCRPRPLGPRAA